MVASGVVLSGDFDHASVLVDEVVAYLNPRPNKVYCDGTTGGGGHLEAILRVMETRAIGIDRDQVALQAAEKRLLPFGERVRFANARFSELPDILKQQSISQVDGIVLDLGVSSPQFDVAERGFSFTKSGPLDMRMDQSRGQTALELIESLDADELCAVISEFGEERYARKIARLIKDAAHADELHTTIDLADVVARAIPSAEQRMAKIHPATRTFQALRIAVNQELDELAAFLAAFPDLLAPGGRCVVISFHSLEDRLVKNAFRDLAWTTSLPDKLAREAGERIAPVVEVLTKKPVMAGEAELARNPRARSAKLRACERTTAAMVPAQARGRS